MKSRTLSAARNPEQHEYFCNPVTPNSDVEFGKIPPACQDNSRQVRIADSSSINALNFSSPTAEAQEWDEA